MSSFHIRPRFQQVVSLPREEIQERLAESLKRPGSRCTILNFPGFLTIRIPDEDRHFWSPRLTLSFDENDSGETVITGIYGPNANVWGIFFYSYLCIGFLGVISLVMGISQWAIGKPPSWLWLAGVALFGLIGIYLVAQFGQKLGVQDTFRIHQAYESAVGEEVPIE